MTRRSSKTLKRGIWFRKYGKAPKAPCHWCGVLLTFHEMTVDHEPPYSQGGTRRQAVLACNTCNQARGYGTVLTPFTGGAKNDAGTI